MTRARRPPSLLSAGRAAAGGALLLAGCTVGIDDRPVPPEPIPGIAAQTSAAATFGAPGASYSAVSAASPVAVPLSAARDDGLVWQTGAQPKTIEEADLPPPAGVADEGTDAAASMAASGEPSADPRAASDDEAGEPRDAPAEAAAIPADPAFRLAPVVGLGAGEAGPLTAALKEQAQKQGIALDAGALVLKTYLSSFPEDGGTTLVYVFDVYDRSGARLTRIDGQEKAAGTKASWGDASAETVNRVAAAAMRRLDAWTRRRTG